MSPVLNCIPSSPPSDREVFGKAVSVPSGESNRSPPEMVSSRPNEEFAESGDSCCEGVRLESEDPRRLSPTNNNVIPLNYKKSPSPSGCGLPFEPPIRPWNSSPNHRNVDRDDSVSPSGSSQRHSSCHRNSVSPDVSSEASRIPSQASSEATREAVLSPDSFRPTKVCPGDLPYDASFPFHDNHFSTSGGFRLSNSFMGDPMNPYMRLTGPPLNPFQPPSGFLGGNPFLGSSDPKFLLNNPGLRLITQQLHHLNGLSTTMNKFPPVDLHAMSVQQLQFLQNHLQNFPNFLQPPPFSKFPENSKNQLSMLIQARKQPKAGEGIEEGAKKSFSTQVLGAKVEDSAKSGDNKKFKATEDEAMVVDKFEINNSDSEEVLSVGSVSPPPASQMTMMEDKLTDAVLNGSNGSSSNLTSLPFNGNSSLKYSNGDLPVKSQDVVTNTKTSNATNRTLKFSIDNILKSDFGSEDVVRENHKESKKQRESERTAAAKKKPETEKEKPVDLSQENANGVPGTEAPMLWPAWVYCTRYSDRPSSGPRTRRSKNKDKNPEEKRPRTAFSGDQLSRLKHEFAENRYLTERRRQDLAKELGLNEAQIKIWFQNKRAKMKKARGEKNPLALQLMAQGLYNHSTIPLTKEEEEAAAAELSD